MDLIIGIIGGVGPQAGVDLHTKIIQNTIANTDQDHVSVIHMSLSSKIMDRTQYILDPSNKISPVKALFDVVKKLYNAGARVMGIPCNSAHAPIIFDALKNEVKKHFSDIILVNMIEEVGKIICENKLKKIALLSTSGTYTSNTYKKILEPQGVEILYPTTTEEQELVHSAIYHPQNGVKACSNPVSQYAIDIFVNQTKKFASMGASHVILGCTEIPLAISDADVDLITIDPTNILARALIRVANCDKLL